MESSSQPDNRQTQNTHLHILTVSAGETVTHKTHLPVILQAQGPENLKALAATYLQGQFITKTHSNVPCISLVSSFFFKQASNTDLLH